MLGLLPLSLLGRPVGTLLSPRESALMGRLLVLRCPLVALLVVLVALLEPLL